MCLKKLLAILVFSVLVCLSAGSQSLSSSEEILRSYWSLSEPKFLDFKKTYPTVLDWSILCNQKLMLAVSLLDNLQSEVDLAWNEFNDLQKNFQDYTLLTTKELQQSKEDLRLSQESYNSLETSSQKDKTTIIDLRSSLKSAEDKATSIEKINLELKDSANKELIIVGTICSIVGVILGGTVIFLTVKG